MIPPNEVDPEMDLPMVDSSEPSEAMSEIPIESSEAGASLPSVEEVRGSTPFESSMSQPDSQPVSEIPIERAETGASLPAVEELRAAQGRTGGRSLASLQCIAIAFLVVLVSFVGIAVAVSGRDKSSNSSDSQARRFSVEDLAEYMDRNGVTASQDIFDIATPQSKAAFWLANEDPRNVALPSVPIDVKEGYQFLTRYVLATVYYATDGDNWNFDFDFLTQDDICDWRATGISSTGQFIPFGALCRATTNLIYELYLGTSYPRNHTVSLCFWVQKISLSFLSLHRPKQSKRPTPLGVVDADNLGDAGFQYQPNSWHSSIGRQQTDCARYSGLCLVRTPRQRLTQPLGNVS